MTTEDLIQILKNYPGMRVMVSGYEDGYDDPRPQVREVIRNKHHSWVDGEYHDSQDEEDLTGSSFPAIVLFRRPESNTLYKQSDEQSDEDRT